MADEAAVITAAQIKAGRKLLSWTPQVLADKARLPKGAVRRAEGLDAGPATTFETLKRIQAAFEAAGVEFMDSGQYRVRIKDVD